MKPLRVAAWALAALTLAGAAHAGGAREEQQRLQGGWDLLAVGYVDKVKEFGPGRRAVLAGDKLAYSPPVTYVLRFAPTRQPKEVDLTVLSTTLKTNGKP